MFTIVGLGNPGEAYAGTRHNAGRDAVSAWVEAKGGSFVDSKKYHAHIYEGAVGKQKVLAMLPDTYMNESGGSVKKAVPSIKAAAQLIVVHDDLDLPLGSIRIVVNRGSGGHNGIRSIERALKTQNFIRIRIGVSPRGARGARKPQGKDAVLKTVMGGFKKAELPVLNDALATAGEAIDCILEDGASAAMNRYNGG